MARSRGLHITIEGLEELGADLSRLQRPGLSNAIRQSLRGAGGEALATEMKLRAPHRTGGLAAGIGVHTADAGSKHGVTGNEQVLVGYLGGLSGGHNGGGRFQLGAWVESGTKPHMIQPRVTKQQGLFFSKSTQSKNALAFDGGVFANARHPGSRAQRVAAKSIKAAEWEVLADIVDVIDGMLTHGTGRG